MLPACKYKQEPFGHNLCAMCYIYYSNDFIECKKQYLNNWLVTFARDANGAQIPIIIFFLWAYSKTHDVNTTAYLYV